MGHLQGGAGNLKSHANPPRPWASAAQQRAEPSAILHPESLRSVTKLPQFGASVLVEGAGICPGEDLAHALLHKGSQISQPK